MLSLMVAMAGVGSSVAQQLLPYQDPDNTAEMRAMDLVERLTFDQKLSLLQLESSAIKELGIPAYSRPYLTTGSHTLSGLATAFPQAIGMAASFDAELLQQVMSAISFEQRIRYVQSRRSGKVGGNYALTVKTPALNINVDPRWGQCPESFGEDPYLTSQMGLATLVGLQGSTDETVYEPAGRGHWYDYDKLHACVTYYGIERASDSIPHALADDAVSARDLAESYLYAFEHLVRKGDVREIMAPYHLSEGKPCCEMDRLLMQILRKEWGYTGLVVNGGGVVGREILEPEVVAEPIVAEMLPAITEPTPTDSVLVAEVAADSSLVAEMLPAITEPSPTDSVLVAEVAADSSLVADVLPQVDSIASDVVNVLPQITEAHSDVAGVLPQITEAHSDVADVLPQITEATPDVANALPQIEEATPDVVNALPQIEDSAAIELAALRVLTERFRLGEMDPDANVSWNHIPNYLLAGTQHDRLALEMAHESIVLLKNDGQLLPLSGKTVALVGVNAADSLVLLGNSHGQPRHTVTVLEALTHKLGTEHVIYRPGPVDQTSDIEPLLAETAEADLYIYVGGGTEDYELPQVQRQTLRRLHQSGKPVVLVCMNGGAVGLEPELETCDAILLSWYGGQQGGQAVADVLCGDYNPSGRLPLTLYRNADQLPEADAYGMEGRTYRYFKGEPLFAFGQGLSYSTFRYGQARFRKRTRDYGELDDAIAYSVVVEITNTSNRDGAEVVQVYLKRDDDKTGPQRTLRGFKRVEINAGETVTVEVPITDIRTYDPHTGGLAVVHGTHTIYWGRSSRLRDLQSMKVEL